MPGRTRGFFELSRIPAIILILFFASLETVYAHGVHVFASVDGDRILTDSYFSDERKVKEGVIKVYDPSGALLLEGKTDENGSFSFRIPQQTDLKIVLEASMGHRAEYLLKADELISKATIKKQPESGPGLLEAGEGVGIILLIAVLFYLGRKIWGLKLKKERNQ